MCNRNRKSGLIGMALLTLALLLSGCKASTPPASTISPSATPSPKPVVLTPYASPTATPMPQATPTVRHATPTPTPTPFFYIVKKGDTLLGIALKLGVSLKALQEANPGLNPNAMSVGTKLVVPTNEENPAGLPTPTPIPLKLGTPVCAPSPDGGAVCLCEVNNPSAQTVGAVEVAFTLGDKTFVATTLLDLIPPHGKTIVVGHAKPPVEPTARATVRLLRALAVPSSIGEESYPPVETKVESISFTQNRLGAIVKGEIAMPKKPPIAEVWVLATAYDENGRAVGARRVTLTPNTNSTAPLEFTLGVYSIGIPIMRVAVTAEAHAAPGK